jgi:beta-RFAP synthase
MRVSVATGCRLHLGFTNLSDDVGRCFGSLGVALDRPSTTVVVEEGAQTAVVGGDPEQVRACLRHFCDHFQVDPRVSIEVHESIPQHVGLGSGTQLALAVGLGLAMVCGIDADVWDIAVLMGRGRRSGVGTAAFQTGGFVVDAGHRKDQKGRDLAPTVVWRRDFPADWRFVVVIPDADRGLSGRREEGVFGALAPSVRISEEVCRITQLRLMPALVEHDIEEFGRALTAVDRKTGAYFSDVQGGVYVGGQTNLAIDALLRAGACGAGQSSWGPAVYGLVHERDVGRVEVAVRESLAQNGEEAQVFVSHGRNTEARVEVQKATS